MKANKIVVLVIAAAAGCGVVSQPGSATGDDGGGSGSGSDIGSGSGSSVPPPVNTLSGRMFDERNDTIDFSTGEPVHTHGGVAIDLSSGQSGCPAVYKYAYLMDEGGPRFGKETTPNGFSWTMRTDIASLDPNATAYRLRNTAGSVMLDWTSIHPDTDGIYHIELHRNGENPIAQLGSTIDELHLEMRFRTTGGNETVVSSCWNNHPMAAPLQITGVQQSALFGLALPAKPALAPLMTPGTGIGVVELPIVQETAEQVALSLQLPTPTGTVSTTAIDTHAVASIASVDFSCDFPSEPVVCTKHAYTTTYPTLSEPIAGFWTVAIVDDVSNQRLCTGTWPNLGVTCTIPARQANEAPHSYRAILSLSSQSLVPSPAGDYGAFGDFTVGDNSVPAVTKYSGIEPQTSNLTYCSRQRIKNIHGVDYTSCIEHTSYARIVAFDKGTLQFDAVPFTLTTGDDAIAAQPAYVTTSMLTFPASTWNAGDAGF